MYDTEGFCGEGRGAGNEVWGTVRDSGRGGGFGKMMTRQDKAKEGLKNNAAAVVGDSTPPKGKEGDPTRNCEESRQTNLLSQFSV